METIQGCQHSVRQYETCDVSTIDTTIIALAEQEIKVRHNGGFLMVEALGIVLEETILHPQGGGQPSDIGFINEIPVISVKEDKQIRSNSGNPTLYHFVDKAFLNAHQITITPNQRVAVTLDTGIRLTHARNHSAGHLIADIIELNPQFSHLAARAISGHHFPDEAYIKVLIHSDIEDRDAFIQLLNDCVVQEIKNDLNVSFHYADQIRHIAIGNSTRKCGGTHVCSTQQIENCMVNKIKVAKPSSENEAIAAFELTVFYTC